jgi:DNA-directed RNA polymerase subunit RPC12/RpoP
MVKQIEKIEEVGCPYCGKKFSLEVLVNIFPEKKKKISRK